MAYINSAVEYAGFCWMSGANVRKDPQENNSSSDALVTDPSLGKENMYGLAEIKCAFLLKDHDVKKTKKLCYLQSNWYLFVQEMG